MLVVTFTGRTAFSAPGTGAGYSIWSYRIESSGPGSGAGELPAGHRIALGLPHEVDVRGPEQYPDASELQGIFIQREAASSRQYVGREITSPGTQTISFVAPTGETTCELLLARAPRGQSLAAVQFSTAPGGTPGNTQLLPAPVKGPLLNGRPPAEFAGMLPYSSELFGIYQPLAGWFGMQNSLRVARGVADELLAGLGRESFSGTAARTLDDEAVAALAEHFEAPAQGVLSPVGLVNLFRQYFFEFDTFLGPPAGHLWLSPGGTVEVVETSTRRTLVERTAEQAEETSRKVEESMTEQDDVADAVKEDNANDTKLGISASGGANVGIYHADASASFSLSSTVKRSSEETHKHTRTQSAKVSSEIKRNFKTTFKTVTETTDTSSRRYVVQNTTGKLVNYELRRKMRKVGVQLQHIGTRLCWQVYLPAPGRTLGLGDLVHIVSAPDLTSIRKPEPPPPLVVKTTQFTGAFPIRKKPGTQDPPEVNMEFVHHDPEDAEGITDHDNARHAVARMDYTPSPPEQGYKLRDARFLSAAPGRAFVSHLTRVNQEKTGFAVFSKFFNSGDLSPIALTFELTWDPPTTNDAHDRYAEEKKVYDAEVAELQRTAYASAVRERLALVSSMRPRPSPDLRNEERQEIYGSLIEKLRPFELFEDMYLGSEVLRQIFDVDEMLYFVAPDYWRPRPVSDTPPPPEDPATPTQSSVGTYPVPDASVLAGRTVLSWYSHTDKANALDPLGHATPEWRVNYLITEESQPAPLGSSLGWLIQIDGDARRNEFLNAAWVKAVLPVRPGREPDALEWLRKADVEGEAALDRDYPFQQGDPEDYRDKKVGEVLDLLASQLETSNTAIANTLAAEEVFETGFDPLTGGFRPADPYKVFDQWIEVLPTDQVVAVEVQYDPRTGQQLPGTTTSSDRTIEG
ncbi:hypothetical protein ACFS5L_13240 [Streptomyces phyllanthi]|uniref:hypothetical protein n=1 Tax=Streptomyces phyllanthi TaxID=1803180 RepID=UPI00128C0C8D|nr:hypothetical protein [Streptomyces phyllanthi]